MIIAVDYDGTLEVNGQMNMALISNLRNAQMQGNIVILWTCRDGQSLRSAVNSLIQCGFQPNLINENAPQTIQRLRNNPRKIFADVYIDDKAVKP